MLADLDAYLAKLEPSLPALSHDLEVAPRSTACICRRRTRFRDHRRQAHRGSATRIVDQQQNLDAALVSVIGLADIGNEVLGENRQPLTDVLHLLVPTTDLTNQYNQALWCALAGMVNASGTAAAEGAGRGGAGRVPVGQQSYRYPKDLPKAGAEGRTPVHRAAEHAVRRGAAVRRRRHRHQPVAAHLPRHRPQCRHASSRSCSATPRLRAASQQCADRTARMRRSLRSDTRQVRHLRRCDGVVDGVPCSSSSANTKPARRRTIRRSSPMPRA